MSMATRINMGLDSDTIAQLKAVARETGTTVSQLCAKYVKQQLEDDEDAYWMKIIRERRNEPTIAAEKVWKMLNLKDN
jgi:predicted DNA-binding protein